MIGQHFTGLRVDINRADVAYSPQAGQCDVQRYAPHHALPTDDQFRLVGGNARADFGQRQPGHFLFGRKRRDIESGW